ncbi:hypothetical protein [Thalassobacillus hwangdonensis]|uniref:Negative regulator of sigma-X activity n=1 Tax=Thalassobacillus hwangdonensis TaxID=546108 RepID=A0ABW3KXZ8_9BACI
MKRNSYNDEKLEKLLGELPRVQDRLSKEELHQKISPQLNENKVKKERAWLVPVGSLVAVVLLMVMVIPILQQGSGGMDSASESGDQADSSAEMNEASMEDSGSATKDDAAKYGSESVEESALALRSHLFFQEEAAVSTVIHSAFLGEGKNTVPVSFIMPKETSTIEGLNSVGAFNVPGLGKYLLEGVSFKTVDQGGTIEVSFPEQSDTPVWMDEVLIQMIRSNFSDTKAITFTDHYGGSLPISTEKAQSKFVYKVFQTEPDQLSYFVPVETEASSLEDAVRDMKRGEQSPNIAAPIRENVQMNAIRQEDQTLIVQFGGQLEPNQDTLVMIEAILATAKSYGVSEVLYENTGLESINGLDLTKPVPVPAAINPLYGYDDR